MNYYKRHLGDYAKKAGHLSPLEHGVYTLILDAYYDREQAPTAEEAMRWARARNPDETQAVSSVLQDFFILTDGRYVQPRVEEELQAATARAEHNRTVGKLGGRPPRARKTRRVPDGLQAGSENNPNPLIHKSTTKKKSAPAQRGKKDSGEITFAEWVDSLAGDDAIPATDPIFAWAGKQGIPGDWIGYAWAAFEDRYAGKDKTYTDWREAFRNHVRRGWLEVWRLDGRSGGYVLTTAGEQWRREVSA